MFKWLYDKVVPRDRTRDLSNETTQTEARLALQQADETYDTVMSRNDKVDHVVSKLREQRERNHFAELLEKSMRGAG